MDFNLIVNIVAGILAAKLLGKVLLVIKDWVWPTE